jgi:hypothetical protein
MKRLVFCVLIVALLIAPGVANALTCLQDCVFNYQFQFADGTSLIGQFTTSNAPDPNAPGAGTGYDILSISGNISGNVNASISGLYPIDPNSQTFPVTWVGTFAYDNVVYVPKTSSGGYFDFAGVVFEDKNGALYSLSDVGDGDMLTLPTGESLSAMEENVSPVPEASSWSMLVLGFIAVGLMAHRRKRRAAYSSF